MAEFLFKDRVTATPNRIKLTKVAEDTYDVEKIPGEISEEGTPLNATTMNKLAQKDGTNTALMNTVFAEAATRANIESGETHATLFGKIRKFFADLKAHAFNALATSLGQEEDKAPTNKLLNDTAALKVDKTSISTVMPISSAAASNTKVLSEKVVYDEFAKKAPLDSPTFTGIVIVPDATVSGAAVNKGQLDLKANDNAVVKLTTDQTIAGVKTFESSPIVPNAAANNEAVNKGQMDEAIKGYADSIPAYDKIIRKQADFEALIDDPDWLGATSVALVGQFAVSRANGIKIPSTVKQIHGFNGAKITITNFVYNGTTAKGGLWYNTLPTTPGYSIRDLEVDCTGTGTSGRGFSSCTNLTNCTGTGTGVYGYGFRDCTNLVNCTGTGTGTESLGHGFRDCTNLVNCTGTGTGSFGYGFRDCTNLVNCTGKGTGTGAGTTEGYGFYNITIASNCKDDGSSNNMWGGTNKNIDVDTCRKTPVEANNTTLNT
jgi:hypothetical protein